MKRVLHIEINAGEKTCYEAPGVPCPMIRTSHFGTVWSCGMFDGKRLGEDALSGWLQRLPVCLAAEALMTLPADPE